MYMTFREAANAERLYAHEQSSQISGQCGSPGYLHGSLDNSGTVFVSSWKRDVPSRNTPEFKAEFNSVLDMLRFDERYGNALKNRSSMIAFCLANPQAQINNGREYVFRADTQDYSYLIRCTPAGEDNHVFIYPYNRQWLDCHIKQAEKGIRFITPDYGEKFRIPGGGTVRITWSDGTSNDRIARYIDEYHLELSGDYTNLYHICELAERLERAGSTIIPLRSSLPEKCYAVIPGGEEIVVVTRGEKGYSHTDKYGHDRAAAQEIVDGYNECEGVTKAQATAMLAGSMFGWDTPAADPKNYDDMGAMVKARHRGRDYER